MGNSLITVVAIVLTSLLMFIFPLNSVQLTSTDTGTVDAMNLQAFNGKFNMYLGTRVSGSQVLSLFDFVRTLETTEPDHPVIITGVTSGEVRTSYKYTVSIPEDGYDPEGYVTTINVVRSD